jgi:hypothetical protein
MTHDPHATPTVPPDSLERPAPLRDLRLRGAIWFVAPFLVVLAAALGIEVVDGGGVDRKLAVQLAVITLMLAPAGVIGLLSGRRCRTTSWLRYLLLTIRDGAAWAIVATLPIFGYIHWYEHGARTMTFLVLVTGMARMAIGTIPVALLLASSLRYFHRRRA